MKKLLTMLVLSIAAVAGFQVSMGMSSNPPAPDDHRVTICHDVEGNGNTGNGYNIITVDKDSIANKDGSFNGHGLDPNDIIPAFAAGSKGNQEWGAFPGRGDASWIGNNCADPGQTTTEPTTPTETEPTTPTETEPTTPTETEPTEPEETEPTETEPPSGERCPPGMTPTAGKDGEPGNDECEFPPTEETPPVVEETPDPEPTSPTVTPPPTVKPPVATPKPPKKASKPPVKKKKAAATPKKKSKKKVKKLVCGNGFRAYKGKCHPIVYGSG